LLFEGFDDKLMSHITDKQYVDADRRVQLYRRTDSKAAYWHAKFRIKGQKKYKRTSSGTTAFEAAKSCALKEFMRTEMRFGADTTVRSGNDDYFFHRAICLPSRNQYPK